MNQTIKHAQQPTEEMLRNQRVQRYLTALGLNGSLCQDLTRESLKRFNGSPEGAGQNHFAGFAMQTMWSVLAERYGSHKGGYPNPRPKDLTGWRLRIWLEGNNKNGCGPEDSPAHAQETNEGQFILRAMPDIDRVSMVPERLDRQPPHRWVRRLKRLAAITV